MHGFESQRANVPSALLARAYLLFRAYAAVRFQARGEWRMIPSGGQRGDRDSDGAARGISRARGGRAGGGRVGRASIEPVGGSPCRTCAYRPNVNADRPPSPPLVGVLVDQSETRRT